MLKRIRDFIYDINDIFVAIIILLAAAGIIIWRSTAIMAYPDYLAAKNPPSNSSEVDFSGIDLTPENVENITQNIEIIEPGTQDPNAPADPNQGGTEDPNAPADPNQGGTEDPNAQTDPNQGGTQDPGTQTDPNQGGDQPPAGTVTATVTIEKGTTWKKVVDTLIAAKLLTEEERGAFMAKLAELKLDTKLYPDTYELTNTSYEDMIKKICRQ